MYCRYIGKCCDILKLGYEKFWVDDNYWYIFYVDYNILERLRILKNERSIYFVVDGYRV